MLKVAITGNIASGKSAFEAILKLKGFAVKDTDVIAHELLYSKDVKSELKKTFEGFDIFEGSEISREKLGKVVFKDKSLLKKLEGILHPRVMSEVGNFFHQEEKQGAKLAFAALPQLFEAHLESSFDKTVLVYTDNEIRLNRLMARDKYTKEQALVRMHAQMSQDEKLNLADYVIYNNKDKVALEVETDKFLNLFV